MQAIIDILKKHVPRILVYGIILTTVWVFIYSAFLKPTKKEYNTGEQYKSLEGAKINTFGCAHFSGTPKKP